MILMLQFYLELQHKSISISTDTIERVVVRAQAKDKRLSFRPMSYRGTRTSDVIDDGKITEISAIEHDHTTLVRDLDDLHAQSDV